jgi:cobalt/nickel transport system permease protein
MHLPDGFLDAPTAVATGALSVGAMAYSLKLARERFDDRQIPLVGVTAAFVFAVQMVNFPVGLGTSGHLLGGALAALLLGPWLGGLVLAVVLLVQGVGFADGGITALGANISWGYLASVGGYYLFVALTRALPRSRGAFLAAGFVTAWTTVIVASAWVSLLIWIGGPFGPGVFAVMVGLHALIGLGEGAITAAVLGAVLATRPDLLAVGSRLPEAAPDTVPAV